MTPIEVTATEFKRLEQIPAVVSFVDISGNKLIIIGEFLISYGRSKEEIANGVF